MEKYIIKSAKTIETALQIACEELSIDPDNAIYEVIKTPSKGFLGIGGSNAEIKVFYDDGRQEDVNQEDSEENIIPDNKKQAKNKENNIKIKTVDNDEIKKSAYVFLDNLFKQMNIGDVDIDIQQTEENKLDINLSGENMGVIIGRRGDTLDSVQYLTSLVVNKDSKDYIKVSIDTENYRAKRRETLRKLALKVAGRVQKYNKNVTLEPMTPYERRIIHSTLQEVEGITTYSIGSEPRRKVVVVKEKK